MYVHVGFRRRGDRSVERYLSRALGPGGESGCGQVGHLWLRGGRKRQVRASVRRCVIDSFLSQPAACLVFCLVLLSLGVGGRRNAAPQTIALVTANKTSRVVYCAVVLRSTK